VGEAEGFLEVNRMGKDEKNGQIEYHCSMFIIYEYGWMTIHTLS
jgi:hypothetical protein